MSFYRNIVCDEGLTQSNILDEKCLFIAISFYRNIVCDVGLTQHNIFIF